MTEEALRRALATGLGPSLPLPDGVKIEPSMEALARAVEAMTVEDMVAGAGVVWPDNREIRLLRHARDRIAAAVRSKRCVPVVDEWANIVGWHFRED